MTKAQNNQYGYARMPRIIRKGYVNLTKLQKLLYIYLRDLCGESGVCYRSLRTLAKETDFSIGYLSINIPELAKAGLIKAEKAKHNNHKWEVWHITIVDIWEENARFIQAEKCSQSEQIDTGESEECSPDKHLDGESVQDVNTLPEKCSRGANKEEKGLRENPLLNEKKDSSALSPEALLIFNWCVEDGEYDPKLDTKVIEYCEKIAIHVKTREQYNSLRDVSRANIRGEDKTVYLGNMASKKNINAWLKSQSQPTPEQQEDDYIEGLGMPGATESMAYRAINAVTFLRVDKDKEIRRRLNVVYERVKSRSRFERLVRDVCQQEANGTLEGIMQRLEEGQTVTT